MSKTNKNVSAGQILVCDCNGGEMSYTLLVTDVDEKNVSGRLYYSSSAYGSAVVHDHLEEGKLITLNWEDITSFTTKDDVETIECIKQAAKDRIEYAKNCIQSDEHVMQSINIELQNNIISVEMSSTLPRKDEEDVPELCKCWYSFNEKLTKEEISRIMEERFTWVSSSGTFLPETKLIFKNRSKGFEFEGTLESGIVTVAGVIPDGLLKAMNLFIDEVRTQYGKAVA